MLPFPGNNLGAVVLDYAEICPFVLRSNPIDGFRNRIDVKEQTFVMPALSMWPIRSSLVPCRTKLLERVISSYRSGSTAFRTRLP